MPQEPVTLLEGGLDFLRSAANLRRATPGGSTTLELEVVGLALIGIGQILAYQATTAGDGLHLYTGGRP